MAARLRLVNFGTTNTGLTGTLGVTIYNADATTQTARTTTGISEFGSTGIYGKQIDLTPEFDGAIVWDTGGASPRYGVETAGSSLSKIENDTDKINIIYNTLKNRADFEASVLNKLREADKPLAERHQEIAAKMDVLAGMSMKKGLDSDEIKRLFAEAFEQVKATVSMTQSEPFRVEPITEAVMASIGPMVSRLESKKSVTPEMLKKELKDLVSSMKDWQAKDTRLSLDQRLGPIAKRQDIEAPLGKAVSRLEDSLNALSNRFESRLSSTSKTTEEINLTLQREMEASQMTIREANEAVIKNLSTVTTEIANLLVYLNGVSRDLNDYLKVNNAKRSVPIGLQALVR